MNYDLPINPISKMCTWRPYNNINIRVEFDLTRRKCCGLLLHFLITCIIYFLSNFHSSMTIEPLNIHFSFTFSTWMVLCKQFLCDFSTFSQQQNCWKYIQRLFIVYSQIGCVLKYPFLNKILIVTSNTIQKALWNFQPFRPCSIQYLD